ncbi:MAG: SDR family oxidoreductase, partial [Alphaproteobacteria bacterium]|nr:SDR family oxidoreductase [Alphaproteobacteria bacterium]
EAAVAAVEAREGRIDILFHAAGTAFRGMAVDHRPEDFARVIAVNLNGSFNVCLAAGRRMIARGEGGKIVLMGSIRGEVASPFGSTAYCTSKGGVHMLGRQLATEWAPHRIYVNCLSPQMVETPFVASTLARPGVRENYLSRIPMGRLGTTGDLIGTAVFLASPASDFVTGHTLFVDGGSRAG